MKKSKRTRKKSVGVLRVLIFPVVGLYLWAVPADWGQVGHTLTMLAVGLRQPSQTAALLQVQEQPSATTPSLQSSLQAPLGTTEQALPPAAADTPSTDSVSATAPLSTPKKDGSGGLIVTQKMSTGNALQDGIAVLNRSGTTVDIAAALQRKLSLKWADTTAPQVLLIHTHTTEGYMLYDAGYYNAADRERTTDETRNVCAVGEAVKKVLEEAGVAVIHDTTVHDSPQYTGAYSRSEKTVQKILKKYPSVQVVLDLHRDAVMDGETTLVKPTVTINGKKAAQMMLLAGVVDTKALPHKNWQQNLTFAARWQQALDKAYPGLMRPLNTVASRYNQHLSTGYLLVEVGSEGNTLEEAVYSGELLGKTLADLLA